MNQIYIKTYQCRVWEDGPKTAQTPTLEPFPAIPTRATSDRRPTRTVLVWWWWWWWYGGGIGDAGDVD